MRCASLILAFAFLLTGPTLAGSADGGVPHIGSFAFDGAPITAPATLVVASIR